MTDHVLLAGAVLLTGAGLQRFAEHRDRRSHPAPGRLVDVGDTAVHVVVDGRGPVVLIDSGLGGSSIEWADVAADLAGDFTVVRYDRPGFAWSPGSRCDRRAAAAAARIIALLDALALPGPALLVGHSLGGLHVRLVAALAPERVSGLVLVDPSHEDMLDVVERSRTAAVTRAVLRLVAWTAPLGMGRLAGRGFARLTLAEHRQPLTPGQLDNTRVSALLTSRTVHGLRALADENATLMESLRQVVAITEQHPEPDLPLTVITSAAPSDNARTAQARSQIDGMHEALVAGRRRARQVLAERSGHLVPLDQPELIAQCIRDIAKTGATT